MFARQTRFSRFATPLAGRSIELSLALAAVQDDGFVGFDEAAQRCGRGLERLHEAVTPAKRRAHGDGAGEHQ